MELKIKLKVKNKEIELTKDEALELKDLLDKLCTNNKEYIPYYPRPWWPWDGTNYPYITYTGNTCDISDDIQVSYSYS